MSEQQWACPRCKAVVSKTVKREMPVLGHYECQCESGRPSFPLRRVGG